MRYLMRITLGLVMAAHCVSAVEGSTVPNAQLVTEEKVLDVTEGIKQVSKGYAVVDAMTGKKLKVGKWVTSLAGASAYTEENFNELGELDGERIQYTSPGHPRVVEHYVKNKKDGLFSAINPGTDKPLIEQRYKDGLLDGESTWYDVSGKVTKKTTYRQGVAVETP